MLKKLYCLKNYIFSDIINSINTTATTTTAATKSIDNDQDSTNEELDPKRFEKISNIIKTYKQSITKLRTNFKNLIIRGSNGTNFYIDIITDNMFIMIVLKDKKILKT